MSTTTKCDNSQTYRFESSTTTFDDAEIFQQELYIAIAAQLTQKWPAREESDHKFIAEKASSLTKTLLQNYNRDFPIKER